MKTTIKKIAVLTFLILAAQTVLASGGDYFEMQKQELYDLETACGANHLYGDLNGNNPWIEVRQVTVDQMALVSSRIEMLRAQGCAEASGEGRILTVYTDINPQDVVSMEGWVELGGETYSRMNSKQCNQRGYNTKPGTFCLIVREAQSR